MADIATSWVQAHPSYMMPETIVQYTQASGAFDLIPTGEPLVRLGETDLYAYVKILELRTKVAAGQMGANQLPSVSMNARQASVPTYLVRVHAEWDMNDTAAMGNWGISLVEAQRLGMRQGTFQQMRNGLLYGFNATNGEGLLNTNGATSLILPPDTNGNYTVITYDNGQMAIFLLTQVSALKTRTMQLGMPAHISICGPQRVLGAMEYQNIVSLTQYQRPGAGSRSTAGVLKDMMEINEDELTWVYDDTLIGKGSGGTDAVLIVLTEVKKPVGGRINTNAFAALTPSLEACTLQLCDMPAPREIMSPIALGGTDMLSQLRVTPGWGLRPEAVTIVSMQYQ